MEGNIRAENVSTELERKAELLSDDNKTQHDLADDLTGQVSQGRQDITELKHQMALSEQSLQVHLQETRLKLEDKSAALMNVDRHKTQLETATRSLQQTGVDVEKRLAQSGASATGIIEDLRNQQARSNIEITDLQTRPTTAQTKFNNQLQDVALMKTERQKLSDDALALRQEMSRLTARHSKACHLSKELERQLADLKSSGATSTHTHDKACAELATMKTRHDVQSRAHSEEIIKMQHRADNLMSELAETKAESARFADQATRTTSQGTSDRVHELPKDIEKRQSDLASVKTSLSETRGEVSDLQRRLQTQARDLSAAEVDLEAALNREKEARRARSDADAEADAARVALRSALQRKTQANLETETQLAKKDHERDELLQACRKVTDAKNTFEQEASDALNEIRQEHFLLLSEVKEWRSRFPGSKNSLGMAWVSQSLSKTQRGALVSQFPGSTELLSRAPQDLTPAYANGASRESQYAAPFQSLHDSPTPHVADPSAHPLNSSAGSPDISRIAAQNKLDSMCAAFNNRSPGRPASVWPGVKTKAPSTALAGMRMGSPMPRHELTFGPGYETSTGSAPPAKTFDSLKATIALLPQTSDGKQKEALEALRADFHRFKTSYAPTRGEAGAGRGGTTAVAMSNYFVNSYGSYRAKGNADPYAGHSKQDRELAAIKAEKCVGPGILVMYSDPTNQDPSASTSRTGQGFPEVG